MRDLISTAALTMSTRDIAELSGKEHRNVMADARTMLLRLGLQPAEFSAGYLAGNNQTQPMYVLPKDLTLTLVSGYNVVMRKRIIDRWLELEAAPPAAPAPVVEMSRLEVIQLLLTTETERLALSAQVAADAPKVAFAEAVRNVDGLCSLEKIAKTLGWGRNRFIAQLKTSKVLQDTRIPYQKYIERGYFEVVEQKPWEDSKGVSHPSFTTMVTGAGQVWLAKNFQHGRMVAPQPAATGAALETAH